MRVTTAVVSVLFASGLIVSATAQDNPDTTDNTTTTTDTTTTDTGTTTTTTTRSETTTTTSGDAISCPPGTTAVRVREETATTARSADTATNDEETRVEMDTIGAGGAPRLRRVEAGDAATTTGAATDSTSAEMSAGTDLSTTSTTTVRTRTTYEEDYRLGGNEVVDSRDTTRGPNYVRTADTGSDAGASRGVPSRRDLGGAGMSRDVGASRARGWRSGGYTSTGVDLVGLSLLSSLLLTGGLLVRRRPR